MAETTWPEYLKDAMRRNLAYAMEQIRVAKRKRYLLTRDIADLERTRTEILASMSEATGCPQLGGRRILGGMHRGCQRLELAAEAAALAYDLAVAEASHQRLRDSVPW